MFNLELMQRSLMNPSLQEAIPDPEAGALPAAVRKFMEAVIQDKGTSLALRKHIANRYTLVKRRAGSGRSGRSGSTATRRLRKGHQATVPAVSPPTHLCRRSKFRYTP